MVLGEFLLEKLRMREERLAATPIEVKAPESDGGDPNTNPPKGFNVFWPPVPVNMPDMGESQEFRFDYERSVD